SNDVAIAQLHGGRQPRRIDHSPVGAAEIGYPEHVATFTHLGMQPRSEWVFDAQVIAGRAAYRYSRSVQIDYGIAARRSSSDYQTWERGNESGRARERESRRAGDEKQEISSQFLPLSRSLALPLSRSPVSSLQTVQNFVYNRFVLARLILIDVFNLVYH